MINYISVLFFLLFQIEIYANIPQLNGQVYSNKLVSVSKGKNSIILQFDNQFKHIISKDFEKYVNFFDLIGKKILHTIQYRPFGPLIQFQFEVDKSIFLIGLNYKVDDIKKIGTYDLTYKFCDNEKDCESYYLLKNNNNYLKVRENNLTPLENPDFSSSIVFLNIKNRKSTKGLSNDFPKHSFDYIIKFEG